MTKSTEPCFAGPGPATNAKRPARFFAKVDGEVGTLLIYDDIGQGFLTEGVTPKGVNAALAEMKAAGAKALHVFINSPGGDVFDGNAIYNAIKRWDRGEKVVHVDGLAASMASVIAMAGDKIRIAANGMIMIHEPWGVAVGDAEHMRERAGLLDTLGENILGTYERRTKQSRDEIKAWMAAETWMDAETAKARGFADEIIPDEAEESDEENAALQWPLLAKFRHAPEKAARLLARASAHSAFKAVNPAATAAQPPPQAAQPAAASGAPEESMNRRQQLEALVKAGTITQAEMDAILAKEAQAEKPVTRDELAAMIAAAVKPAPASAAAVPSPVADVLNAAANAGSEQPKAPRVTRYAVPRAVLGRESRSNESAKSDKHRRALQMARLGCGIIIAKENAMPVADAMDVLGFRETAEKYDAMRRERSSELIAQGAAMSEGDAAAGGTFAPTEMQQGYIAMLDEMPGVLDLIPAGNRIRSKAGSIQWPTITSGVTGAWTNENPTTGNPEALGTGTKTLVAKKMRVEVLISRQLLRDSFSNIDQIVLEKMTQRTKQLEAIGIVEGKGAANEPRGLATIRKSTATRAQTADVTYENARTDLGKLLKALAVSKVPAEAGRAFVGAEQAKWALMDLINPAGSDYPFEAQLEQGMLRGHPARFSTLLGTTKFYCFAPGEALFFEQLAMFMENDNVYINNAGTACIASGSDQTVLRLWRMLDFDLMHDEAVEELNTVTWGN